jgi:hypothetical protein
VASAGTRPPSRYPAPTRAGETERAITLLATTFIVSAPTNEARFWQGAIGLDRHVTGTAQKPK